MASSCSEPRTIAVLSEECALAPEVVVIAHCSGMKWTGEVVEPVPE